MPIPSEYQQIVDLLITKTAEGVLKWTEESVQFSVTVNGSKVSLWSGVDEHSDESFVAFGLYGSNGKVIDSWYLDESEQEYQSVITLYNAARRAANDVPGILQNLVKNISTMRKED